MASLFGSDERQAFARRVRLEMARAGLTRESLAARAACKERTLGNLLAGQPVRDATLAKVARALAIDLDELAGVSGPERPAAGELRAGAEYGGYMLSAYESYIGTYLAWRRSFTVEGELVRSVYEIDWDEQLSRLRFFELQRFRGAGNRPVTSSHAGGVHISPHTGLVQLLTTYQGALRLLTLAKFRMGEARLRGVILTQSDRDVFFQPAVSPIFLERLDGRHKAGDLERLVGPVRRSDPQHAAAARELADIQRTAILIAGAKPGE
jgi:transcriptional regulator with XRE-family HTH domain